MQNTFGQQKHTQILRRLFSVFTVLIMLIIPFSSAAETAKANQTGSDPRNLVYNILKGSTLYYLDETEALAPYYEMAAERKISILNSATEIVKADEFIPGKTYTGNAYYISPGGSDYNSGLSPNYPWKTAERANYSVQEGDAVFFERGGVYHLSDSPLFLSSNVTYSAYGEGAKPVLTLAQENSARAECWELWHEGENGEKIWRYYKGTDLVGGIVMNDESYTKHVLEWPTTKGWMALDFKITDPANGIYSIDDSCGNLSMIVTNEYRTVEENLTEDLSFIWRTDIEGITIFSYPLDFCEKVRAGELYLRCDAGNPGELYNDIAVISVQRYSNGEVFDVIVDGSHANGWVLDNLSLKYYATAAVLGSLFTPKDAIIQNCTIEWGGNHLFYIKSAVPTSNYFVIGDSIYCVANNATIRNNYIRQSANGFTFESSSSQYIKNMGTYTAVGNLMENCGQGIRISLASERLKWVFDEIILRDNIVLDTGNSMNNANFEEPAALDFGIDATPYAKHIEFSDNIMISSTVAMIRIPGSREMEMPIDFHGNIIAQRRNGALITECAWNSEGKPVWFLMKNAKK